MCRPQKKGLMNDESLCGWYGSSLILPSHIAARWRRIQYCNIITKVESNEYIFFEMLSKVDKAPIVVGCDKVYCFL